MDHNSLGAVLAGTLRFIHIYMVDQFPKQRCGQGLRLHELANGMDELIPVVLHGIKIGNPVA